MALHMKMNNFTLEVINFFCNIWEKMAFFTEILLNMG